MTLGELKAAIDALAVSAGDRIYDMPVVTLTEHPDGESHECWIIDGLYIDYADRIQFYGIWGGTE